GQKAHAEIIRPENLVVTAVPTSQPETKDSEFHVKPSSDGMGAVSQKTILPPTTIPAAPEVEPMSLDAANEPLPAAKSTIVADPMKRTVVAKPKNTSASDDDELLDLDQ